MTSFEVDRTTEDHSQDVRHDDRAQEYGEHYNQYGVGRSIHRLLADFQAL